MTRSLLGQDRSPVGASDEGAGSLRTSTGATTGPVPGGAAPRGYRAARWGLFGAHVLLLAWLASRSFFFSDDFLYGSLLRDASLDKELLIRSWFGHLVPGFIAADWTFIRVVGLNWPIAAALMVAVTLAATVSVVRLLEALCGRVWRTLVVSALFAFSLMITTQVLWWGAVMTNIVPLAASIATLGSFVRWARSGRGRHLVSMTACFVLAVSFYEKSILTAAYVGLLSLLVLDAGLPWRDRVRTTLRRWPAWVLLGGIAIVDVGWYLTHDYLIEAGTPPTARDLAAFLFHSFTEGFAPSFLGMHQPGVSLLGSPLLTMLVADALLLGVAVVTSLRSRRALEAWVFFALAYLLNQAVLGRGRVAIIGPHMGTLLRYQLENTVLFCIALAVAAPYLRGAWPRRWAPRLRGRALTSWAVFAVLAALLAPLWVVSLREEMRVSTGIAAREWFDTVRGTLAEQRRENPDLAVVDGVVPGWLVYAQMAPFNRYERVLPQVLGDVPFTRTEDRGLSIDESGTVHPVAFETAADLGGAGTCLTPGTGSARVELKLPELLPEQLWFVDVQYTAEAGSALRIQVDNQGVTPDLRMGTAEYETEAGNGRLVVAPAALPVAEVALEVIGPAEICLRGVEVGAMQPES
jgi:hypothetical protein